MKSNPEGDTDVSGEEVSLLESGACGAFVHGLEDENSEVRLATIGYFFIFISYFWFLISICWFLQKKKKNLVSMKEFALRNYEFASSSIDFLVGIELYDLFSCQKK